MSFPPLPIEGDPQYIPLPPPEHTYGYGPQHTPPAVKRCDPRVGWWLVAAALLAVIAVFLPWFHFLPPVSPDPDSVVSVGDERGGLVTIVLSLGILAAGAWISCGRGDLWSPIGALVGSALTIFFLLLALAGETALNAFAFANESTAEVSYGFWLESVAAAVALILSIAALVRRRPVR